MRLCLYIAGSFFQWRLGYANGQMPERDEEVWVLIHRNRVSYPEVELAFYRYDSSQFRSLMVRSS